MFPLLTGRFDQVFITCPIGAAIAIASVVIARKAELAELTQPHHLRNIFFTCFLTPVWDAVNPSKEA
jgi:hypothetical protein